MGDDDQILPRAPSDPDDLIYQYTYTDGSLGLPVGLPLTELDPLGRTTRYSYETTPTAEDFGWVQQVTYAEGTADQASVQFEYDAAGNITAEIDELGHRTEYEFDALDRLTKVTRPDPVPNNGTTADQPVIQYRYDANDNLIEMIDGEGNRTQYSYDAVNRLVEIQQERPDGPQGIAPHLITSYTYDASGNLVSEVDPAGSVTRYHYDALDRRIATVEEDIDGLGVLPLTNPVNPFDVDADGEVGTRDVQLVVDNLGNNILFGHDARLETPHYFDADGDLAIEIGDQQVIEQFILSADVNGDGHVDAAEIQQAGVQPNYIDTLGRPVTIFHYDAVGNLAAQVDANGNQTRYRYDERHRLVETNYPPVEDELGNLVTGASIIYQYDLAGQITEKWTRSVASRTIVMTMPAAGLKRNCQTPETEDQRHSLFTIMPATWSRSSTLKVISRPTFTMIGID